MTAGGLKIHPALHTQHAHGRTLSMPYTIVFNCGICDMPYLHTVSHLLLNWGSGRHTAVKMASRSPESPHPKPVGFNLSRKAKYGMVGLVRLIFMLTLPKPALRAATKASPVSCPLSSLLVSRKGPPYSSRLPWPQLWEFSPRSRTGQHPPRCTTGESTFRPLLRLLDRA